MSSPLLRIRAGIEAGNADEVVAGVKQADTDKVTLAPNVRDMITQWLKVNAPNMLPQIGIAIPASAAVPSTDGPPAMSPPTMSPPTMSPPKMSPPAMSPPSMSPPSGEGSLSSMSKMGPSATPASAPARDDDEGISRGDGNRGWSSSTVADNRAPVGATADPNAMRSAMPSPEKLRLALLRFFEGAPKGSDAALGLGIIEDETDGTRYVPFSILGRAVNLSEEEDLVRIVQRAICQAQSGIFSIAPDGSGAGLIEWAGWEEFTSALALIATATRDPAFEPRSIAGNISRCAHGAVHSGSVRQASVLAAMQDSLSPQDMPEDAAPALRSAISRRTRLALACLVDAVASAGLANEAGPDAMGLVGQLPRTIFSLIFDQIDDRDRGACAFLSEILKSWDRRRCFSKRWLQDAAGKFTAPKGANQERDEGKGWYALTAENASRGNQRESHHADDRDEGKDRKRDAPRDRSRSRKRDRSRSRDRGGRDEGRRDDDSKHKANKKRGIVQEDDDDDAVDKQLAESRKRRAALMAKYSDDR